MARKKNGHYALFCYCDLRASELRNGKEEARGRRRKDFVVRRMELAKHFIRTNIEPEWMKDYRQELGFEVLPIVGCMKDVRDAQSIVWALLIP